MKISVVIPSYRRAIDLTHCLQALCEQTRSSDEVIVVARPDDQDTWDAIREFGSRLPVIGAKVFEPGLIQAENIGIALASGNIIAFTDDDAKPDKDWLSRIIDAFDQVDDKIVGVGGRDTIYSNEKPDERCNPIVGRLSWFGRLIGNHEFGCGGAVYVDTLKGVNMAFRSAFIKEIGLDIRLKGSGAQMHSELMLCLSARKKGLKLLYDPSIHVNHYPGKRYGRDQRIDFNENTMAENVHNETLAILSYFSLPQKIVFLMWSFFVGHRGAPGIVQIFRLGIFYGLPSMAMFKAAQQGRFSGLKTWAAGKNEH